MKSSIAFIVALVTIALAEAGTNKTLAPTPGVSRPPDTEPPVETQPPITPFPTESTIETSPPVDVPTPPTYTVSCWSYTTTFASSDLAIFSSERHCHVLHDIFYKARPLYMKTKRDIGWLVLIRSAFLCV